MGKPGYSMLVCCIIFVFHINEGESILCHSPAKGTRCSSTTSTCAIRQDSSGPTVKLERFCETGDVGCKEVGEVITCYCDTNNCNKDLKLAGWKKVSSSGSEQTAALKNNGQPQQLGNNMLKMIFLGIVIALVCELK